MRLVLTVGALYQQTAAYITDLLQPYIPEVPEVLLTVYEAERAFTSMTLELRV